MQKYKTHILTTIILVLVFTGAAINHLEKLAVDKTRLPQKVEYSKGFQRWITNIKNKGLDVSAKDFRLKEEVAIYNTRWMTISSIDDEGVKKEYDRIMAEKQTQRDILEKIIFSPSKRIFVDYRNESRDGYEPNEVHFYGLRDDKVINARILDCSVRANCYFDRGYFLESSNDVFVVSEFSRTIDKKNETAVLCALNEVCNYSIKLHLVDLVNNSRLVYESNSFDVVLADLIPEL